MIKENRLLLGTSPFGYPTPRTAIDSQGRCRHHPHIVLRKKSVMRGWKIVVPNCPECVAFNWKRRRKIQQQQIASKPRDTSESIVDDFHRGNATSASSSDKKAEENSSKGSRRISVHVSKNHAAVCCCSATREPRLKPSSDDRTVVNPESISSWHERLQAAAMDNVSPSNSIPANPLEATAERSRETCKNSTSPRATRPKIIRRASTGNAPSPQHVHTRPVHGVEIANGSFVRLSSEHVPKTYCARATLRAKETGHLSNPSSFTSYKSQKSIDPDDHVANGDNSQSKLQSTKQTSSLDKSKRNSSCSSSKKSSRDKYYSHSITSQINVVQDSTNSSSTLDISIDVKHHESCSIEGIAHQDIADQTCTGGSPHESHHSKMQSIPQESKVPHHTHDPPIAPNDAEDVVDTFYSRRLSAPTPSTFNKDVASRMREAPILTKHTSFTSYKSHRSADPDRHIMNHENVKSKSTKKSSQEMRHSYFDISERNVAHDFTNSKRTLDMNTGVIRGERCVMGRGMKSDIAPNENDCSEMPEVFLATEGSGLNAHNRGEKSAKPAVNAFFTRRSSAPTPSTYIKGMVPRASQSPFPSKHASFISYKSQTSVNLDGQVDHDYTPKLHDLTQMSSDQPNRTADCSSLRKSAHETRQSYFVICETNIAQDFMNSKSTLEMNTGVKHGEKCGTWRGTQVDAVNQAHTTKNPHENECSSVPFIPTTQESELKITKHGDHLSNPSISSEAAVNTFFSRRSSAPTLTTNMGLAAARIREAPFPSKHVYLTSCKSQRLTGTNRHDMNRDNLHSESPKKSSQEMNRSYFAISETNVAQDFTNSKGTLEMNTSVKHVEYCGIRRGMHSDIANQTSKAERPYENDFLVMPSIAMRQVSKLKKKKHSDHLSNPLVSSESDVKKFFGRRSSAPTSTINKGIAAVSMRGAAFTSKHSSFTSYRSQMLTGNDRHDMNHDNFLSESPNKSSQEMNHSEFVVSKTNVAQDFTDSKSTLEMNTSVKRREFCGFGRGVHSEIADQTSTRKGHDENGCFETHFISTTQESTLKEPNEGDCPSVPHINADLVVSPIFIRRSSAPTPSTFNEGMVSHASKAPFPSKHSSFTSYKSPRSIDPDGHVIDHNYTQYKQALKQISSDELKFNTDCSSPKKSVQEMNHSYFVISESNVAQDFTNSKSTLEMNTNDKQCVPLSPSSSHDFPIFEDRFSDNQPCQQQSLTKSNPKAVPKEENLMLSIPEYATPSPSAVGSRGKQESESEERDLEDDTLEGSESYPCIFIPNSSAQLHAYSTCSSFSESTFSNMIASSFAMSFAENSGENEPEECSFIFASGMRHVLSVPPYDEGSYTGQIKELTKLPHGEGSFIHSSGELINGIWRDGVFIRRFYKQYGHSPSESHPSSQDKTPVVRNR